MKINLICNFKELCSYVKKSVTFIYYYSCVNFFSVLEEVTLGRVVIMVWEGPGVELFASRKFRRELRWAVYVHPLLVQSNRFYFLS